MPYQILLVDDDPDFREELRECLFQYKIIEAASGEEALRIIKKPHAIDLVLMDVVMPGLPGTEVLREMRKITSGLAIIILTGNSSKDVAVEALKGQANDYIEKPFEQEKFHKTIQRVLASVDGKNGKGIQAMGKMERARNFLKNNCDKKVGLEDVARELCLSPKYLSRLFKDKTGTGFNEYRLKVKMEMAQELLRSAQLSVQDIADRLGYKNVESFVRIFKKLTGKTPSMYRLKRKGASCRT